jgi:hypothetical protein
LDISIGPLSSVALNSQLGLFPGSPPVELHFHSGNTIMATFTKIAEDQIPTIAINPEHKISRINDNIYGGFTECGFLFKVA